MKPLALLDAHDLALGFPVRRGLGGLFQSGPAPVVRALNGVTLSVDRGETLTAADGTSDASVAKVVIARSSGGDVTATVKDGYWVAWWPGDAAFEKATAFAADGTEIKAITP